MLQITIPSVELWDERTQQFLVTDDTTLQLEHSLVSLHKWESKWNKAFLTKREKTTEEIIDYVKCMTLTKNVNPEVYLCLTADNFKQIQNYIEAPMTATTFADDKQSKNSREVITSELIYYWMIALNIPFECQTWHLNRLLTLVKVCNIKNQPPKKRSSKDIVRQNAALNEARRKRYNSRG